MVIKKSEMEHKYTSTGIKFWKHRKQLESYKNGEGHSIISTHISPTGFCNLGCSYCSVSKRDKHEQIELSVIKDYTTKLVSRGLKAIIITGGGEPTFYSEFNELITWLHDEMKLKVALITNGTNSDSVKVWDKFSWVRVSINNFPNWETKISIPIEKLNSDCTVGFSLIYAGKNIEILRDISNVADKFKAEYVRLLPDCMFSQKELLEWHETLAIDLKTLEDKRFFHQFKIHGAPQADTCYQAFFRPYLSEVNGGTVYPCDSIVLTGQVFKFTDTYAICKAEDVLLFLDNIIKMKFDPSIDCEGCVFTQNVEMLQDYIEFNFEEFDLHKESLKHEEFV